MIRRKNGRRKKDFPISKLNPISLILLCIIFMFSGVLGEQPITKSQKINLLKMKKLEGFYNLYWQEDEGKIWLEIDKIDQEFLYVNSLTAGLGSNDIGLDRNQLGSTRIVKFHRVGPKILMIQSNYSFRALSENPDEKQAVEEAFAKSVIWGFTIVSVKNNRYIVDATLFFLEDAKNVVGTLKQRNQGNYKPDRSRSAIYLPRTKNFPNNTEVEAILTFVTHNPGRFVRQVAANPGAVTLRQRHSFIKLPDNKYKPRIFDPRSNFFAIQYMDFATPIDSSITKRFICRHRLFKKNPRAKISEAVEPIIYYVDRGVPEPIRSALVEGARWWDEAFASIGYRNAFQVKVLPKGADPMDVRYNMINWIHRSTRGWSYGSTVIDPRTGEIIKGHIALGSLRIRQDYLIAQGLVGNFNQSKEQTTKMKQMALLRIKQLSCHEVGHTLGLGHNYASSVNDRASVMDYPHPLVKIGNDGNIDLSDAYTREIGAWDKVSIAYGYQDFPQETNEEKALQAMLDNAFGQGLYFLSDDDARGSDSAHPLAHLWDNGKHPVDELQRVMKIRSLVLSKFSENKIPFGTPLATLEEVLVPVYMFHRYQIEACAKVVGGLYYNHSLRGDNQKRPQIVPAAQQRRALAALLATIQPESLKINESILNLLPPRPPSYPQTRELFPGYTGRTFDPLAAAENVADITIGFLLNAQRCGRLVEYHARDNKIPGLLEVMDKLISATWRISNKQTSYSAEIQRVVNMVVLNHLIRLAVNPAASGQVRAITMLKLEELKNWLGKVYVSQRDSRQRAHFFYGFSQIKSFFRDPKGFYIPEPSRPPDGSPIGN